MSASLVGSEMCIRDSISNRTNVDIEVRGRAHTEKRNAEIQRLMHIDTETCLLYTSDAADDM
eukprot:10815679-Alexandrium_andersonii.AAC.1